MRLQKIDKEEKCIKDFLKLPASLYGSKDNTEDPDSMKKILLGEHPLSKYFKLDKFLAYDDRNNVTGRFCITSYEGDSVAYLGFFECVNDPEAAKFLFDSAYDFCAENGFESIQGPVDASFWIKYRLKINKFEPPYTGEPYNKDYYFKMFKDNGFEVIEHYTSNEFRSVDESYVNKKFAERYKSFLDNGYEIRSVREDEIPERIDDVYELIAKLYSDFPIFKYVSKEDFREVFKSYGTIMDTSMTKVAFHEGKMVGFYISVPDFGNLVYHTGNPLNLMKILKLKKKPERYVMLYMGVDERHRGLGKALVYAIMKELMESGLPSIGALIRDGKVNQNYASDEIADVFEYVLLERKIG